MTVAATAPCWDRKQVSCGTRCGTVVWMRAADMTDLPVEGAIAELRSALADVGTAVLAASPGAGKTTVVPLRLLDEKWLAGGRILLLEPRRLAARAAARRMADLLGGEVGGIVGYRTKVDSAVGRDTRIEVVTEGILTRRIQRDPELAGVGLVIFDEFHERSLVADLGLALTLESRQAFRSDLRLLVMSATLDTDRTAALVGGAGGPAPIIEAPGRSHPVDLEWVRPARPDQLEHAVVEQTLGALDRFGGDALVFLSGAASIRRVADQLTRSVGRDVDVRLLFGALTPAEQDQALRPSPSGRRKVVVATDIAESSLTVEGVRIVVDSGQRRVMRHDPRTGMGRLTTTMTSRASADQRTGRAGREAPGHAIRLWPQAEHSTRPAFERPQVLLDDITGFVLDIACWGAAIDELALLDQPTVDAIEVATELLHDLGAVARDGRVTTKGRAIADLPIHPRLGAMIVDARGGSDGWMACIAATVLENGDVLRGRPHELPTELGLRVALVDDPNRRHGAAAGHLVSQARRDAKDLARRARVERGPIDIDQLGAVVVSAYPDRTALQRGQRGRFLLRSGVGASLAETDALAGEQMLVVADVDGAAGDARIRLAVGIDLADVEQRLGASIERQHVILWDAARGDVVARVDDRLGSLVLRSAGQPVAPGPDVVELLLAAVDRSGLSELGWSDRSRRLQSRIELARAHGRLDAPAVDDESLRGDLATWLGPLLSDATLMADVRRLDLVGALMSRVGWHQQRELDRLVPERWVLPSGRTVSIDYTRERPTITGKVQEFFGSPASPAVLDGELPLTVELLSPANRPLQITADLAGFWAGSWTEVRKEMAGRYPRHRWPDDPTTAEAGRSIQRRRN